MNIYNTCFGLVKEKVSPFLFRIQNICLIGTEIANNHYWVYILFFIYLPIIRTTDNSKYNLCSLRLRIDEILLYLTVLCK